VVVQSLQAFQYGRLTQSARTVYTTQHMLRSVDPDRKDYVPTRHRNRQTWWVRRVGGCWVGGRADSVRPDYLRSYACACACVYDVSYARTRAQRKRNYVLPFDNHAIHIIGTT